MGLNQAQYVALCEARCRARAAKQIGKPAALQIPLTPLIGRHFTETQFLLGDGIDPGVRQKLLQIPDLICPKNECRPEH